MINVLVPITTYSKKYKDVLLELSDREDINLLVGVTNKIKDEFSYLKSGYVHIYDDSFDKESILNALFNKVDDGALVIMRQPITAQEFDRLVTKGEHVVTCKKERNRVKSFFFKLWQKILKLFIGVNLYMGDTSVVYFSETLLPVLIESGNLSYASRVDRWIGVEKATEEIKCQSEKYEPEAKSILRYSIYADICILIACFVTTFVCIFADVGIVLGLLLFGINAICLAITLISVILIVFNFQVGKKNVDVAVEISNLYNKNEEE